MALLSQRHNDRLSPGRRLLRRLLNLTKALVVLLAASAFCGFNAPTPGGNIVAAETPPAVPATLPAAPSGPGQGGVPTELVEAIRRLSLLSKERKNPNWDADAAERKKIYDLLADKGDMRLIAALEAYRDGKLLDRNGVLVTVGDEPVDVNGARMYKVLDVFTRQQIQDPSGPVFRETQPSPGEPGFFRLPPLARSERSIIVDVVTALSLAHPDPEIRIYSIREAGERAGRVFTNVDDQNKAIASLEVLAKRIKSPPPTTAPATQSTEISTAKEEMLKAIDAALAEKHKTLMDFAPSQGTTQKAKTAAMNLQTAMGLSTDEKTVPASSLDFAVIIAIRDCGSYGDDIDKILKNREEVPKYATALRRQLNNDPSGPFSNHVKEALAQIDAVGDDAAARSQAIVALGNFGTLRCLNVLKKLHDAAERINDAKLIGELDPLIAKAESYQLKIRLTSYTFYGLSTGSIYVLLALGLAIIFGLMGVINMAHGEFMMIGAFATYVVSQIFHDHFPSFYNYFPIFAVPAAFLVSGVVGLITEYFVIRHLYGRTIETLLATIGVGFILIWLTRYIYGDNLSVAAPDWMQGSWEVIPDLKLNRARLWTIAYCVICITVVYLIVNRTKLGLLLRATTQNRKMAAALGVPTRRVDALTFAVGAGLAGMAGVAVSMVDKVNPQMGQDYVVKSFMVVVVGGVGNIAGTVIAGLGLGAIGAYLEPLLGGVRMFAETSSVLAQVLVLAGIVLFLNWRPSGLFPPKGRLADA